MVYVISPRVMKNLVLLISSLIFYAWGEPACVFLMAGSVFVAYWIGIGLEKYHSKRLLAIGIVLEVGVLFYFKYANFFLLNIKQMTGIPLKTLAITLPVGISFYTFQLLSYLIDVYRKEVPAQRNLCSLATYIAMFPQLIAGPIVRYADVEKELKERTHDLEKIAYGIRRFVMGLSKKVLIADLLGEFCTVFRGMEERSLLFCWAYAVAISLQIYFDFSGYSDMAIGLGRIFGFHFLENFQYPFVSKSITEFWRRWHISLGNWFRDYVYIPLGGNRGGKRKQIRNLLIVWCLTGLWHGAEWTFVIWGLWFGALLILEKMVFAPKSKQNHVKKESLGSQIGRRIYVWLAVLISFVIFDAVSVRDAFWTLGSMFGFGKLPFATSVTTYYLTSYAGVFMVALIGATQVPKRLASKIKPEILTWVEPVVMLLLLFTVTAYLVDGSFHPFLYFRF